jgi:hypothetical protein
MKKFATLLTISTTAYGLAFDGPLPTPVADLVYAALDGYSPRPTNEARSLPDLFRRQKKGSAVCGYLEGDAGKHISLRSPSLPCPHNQSFPLNSTTQPTLLPTPTNHTPSLPPLLHLQRHLLLLTLPLLVRLLRRPHLLLFRHNNALHQLRLRLKLPRRPRVLQRRRRNGVHGGGGAVLREYV